MKRIEFAGNLGGDPKYFEAKGKSVSVLSSASTSTSLTGARMPRTRTKFTNGSPSSSLASRPTTSSNPWPAAHVFGWGNLNLRPMEHVRTDSLLEALEDLDDDDITVAQVKKLVEGDSREVSLLQVNAQQIAPSTKFQSMEVEKNAKKSKSRKTTKDDEEEDETPKTKTRSKVGAKASSKSKAASEDEDDDW